MNKIFKKPVKKKNVIPPKKTSIFPEIWKRYNIPAPIPEYQFLVNRKFRIDYAWPEYLVGMEIEGGIYSGGRHITPKGFINDMEKYNLMNEHGWNLLRYAPKKIDYLQILKTIENNKKRL